MCGIFVVINKKSEPLNLSKCKKALNEMHRRGPDWNFYKVINKNIFIGQVVLSMTGKIKKDVKQHYSISKNYFIVFNGEIYNYRNLANEKSVYFDCGFTIWLKPDGTWYHKIHGVSGFSSNKGPYKIVNSHEINLGGNDYIKWDEDGVRCLKWGKLRNNNCCQ